MSDELVLTVEQAAKCLFQAHHEAPYTAACRLAVAAEICRDEQAQKFWRAVGARLDFHNPNL